MAFTVDFGPTETKALGITDSISKYAPTRHRRSMSQSKAERGCGSDGGESGNSKGKQGHNSENDCKKAKGEATGKLSIPSNQGASGMTSISSQSRFKNPRSGANEELPNPKPPPTDDDLRSETGTYTVELDGPDEAGTEIRRFGTEEEVESESTADSSLEWVREWAERASKEIEHNPSPVLGMLKINLYKSQLLTICEQVA